MRRVEKCAKCESTAVAQRVMIVDRGFRNTEYDLRLRVDANPSAVLVKKSERSKLHAFVCSDCGYVEFYADDPKALYHAFLAAKQNTPQIT